MMPYVEGYSIGGKPWRFIAEKVLPLLPVQVWELLSNTEHLTTASTTSAVR